MEDLRKIAIYSRKSKFTGKGESIESQIDMCKEYVTSEFSKVEEKDILVFEDEGYSGGNTNRPQFQKMLKECRSNNIKLIVCYKLDRISRSISDFIKLTEELDKLHIDFVSINDKYETHTSTGRAMLSMTMVFAQLERETIAERIRDNMLYLAKDGRWLGGNTPTGYKSAETVGSIKMDGKTRKARMLEIVDEEASVVKLIFSKFLEYKSLTKVETYMIQHDVLTKQNMMFNRFAIKNILKNPVYMIADEQAWNYFTVADAEIYSDREQFDGVHGMMVYNKTSQRTGKSNTFNSIRDWIIAVGKHEGLIKGYDWVEAQKLLEQNRSKSYHKPKSNVALLSGLLFCGNCGSFMRPKLTQRRNKDGELIYDYLCELKEKSKSDKCTMKRPNGNELDKRVCQEVKCLAEDSSDFMKNLRKGLRSIDYNDDSYQEKLKELRKSKAKYDSQIKKLLQSLLETEGTAAHEYIIDQINEIDSRIKSLDKQIQEYIEIVNTHSSSDENFEILADMMSKAANAIDSMTVEEKRSALRNIIHRVIWDGDKIHIYFFGCEEDEIDLSDDENSEPQREGCKRDSDALPIPEEERRRPVHE